MVPMSESQTGAGLQIVWGAAHRDKDGTLISYQCSLEPPAAPTCLRWSCLWRYLKATLLYALVANYHTRRLAYAEANRHKVILERYRTGEHSPQTIWQAIHANIKLTCPVCRKYNVDPLLFKRGGNNHGSDTETNTTGVR